MRTTSWVGLMLAVTAVGCGERQPCTSADYKGGPRVRLDIGLGTCNMPPVIRVAGPRSASKGAQILLDAAASSDANGDALAYHWELKTKPAASQLTLEGVDQRAVSFIADGVGAFVLQLELSDGDLTTKSEPIVVAVSNDAPVANAGEDSNVAIGVQAVLDGTRSTDPNGDPLTFAWAVTTAPSGSNAAVSSPTAPTTAFIPDVRGRYELTLTVSDGNLMATDTVLVFSGVSRNPPVAVAVGNTGDIAVGTTIQLDGTGSSDADGDAITYNWQIVRVPPASRARLSDLHAARPTFVADQPGDFVVELIVDDGFHQSAPANLTFTATGMMVENPPVIRGPDTFDANRVYQLNPQNPFPGQFGEYGVCEIDGLHFLTGGFPISFRGGHVTAPRVVLRNDGSLLYTVLSDTESRVYKFASDDLSYLFINGGLSRYTYDAAMVTRNDGLPLLTTPEGITALVVNAQDELFYRASSGWYDVNNVQQANLSEHLLAIGTDGAQLADFVIDPAGGVHAYDFAADVEVVAVRARPGGGFWVATAADELLQPPRRRWLVQNDGTATVDLELGPLHPDVLTLQSGAIDADGNVYFNCVNQMGRFCVTKFVGTNPSVVTIDQDLNKCRGDFPSFVTGGGVISVSGTSDDPSS